MRVYKYASRGHGIPKEKRAIALGFFDGVHIGHRKILELTVKEARERGLIPAVFTFISESSEIKFDTGRLYSTEEKLSLIKECGIEEVIIADFASLRDMTGEEFVRELLAGELSCVLAISGEDFRFGKGASCEARELSRLMRLSGGDTITVSDVEIDGVRVSTTYIKRLLSNGEVRRGAEYLGAPYFCEGLIESGRRVGRALGFPTINLSPKEGKSPLRRGVYISEAIIDNIPYPALSNVGVCPTFEERGEHIESYILNFEGDLYGKRVKIIFRDFLRDEIQFPSENELILQIKVDINRAKEEFFKNEQSVD